MPTHHEKIRDTLISKNGKDYFSKLAKKGGAASTSRPFKDSQKAREAVASRWARYYTELDKLKVAQLHGEITEKEFILKKRQLLGIK